jgi:ABC-type multidrug transport system permease subunit
VDRNPIIQLTLGKVRDLLRTPEALFWVFVFPLLMALALGVAFRTRGPEPVRVGVLETGGADSVHAALDGDGDLAARVLDEAEARDSLRAGRVSLVVIPGDPVTFWFDPSRPESRLARALADAVLQADAGRQDLVRIQLKEVTEPGSRYIDFVVPGLVGMNLMGTGLWGIGFSIVMARSRKLLKRMSATPMRRHHFLLGQVLGRIVFLILEVGALLLFARFAFGVPIRGSILSLIVVTLMGAMTFAGIGLLVASRTRTIEGISGLMNVVMLPMWILSGIFFSTERFPDAMQPLVQALPLTAVNDALRGVMIEGGSLASQAGELAITGAWGVASFVAALWLFRWS